MNLAVISALSRDIGLFASLAGQPASPREDCPEADEFLLYTRYFIEQDLPLPPALEAARSRIAAMATWGISGDEDKRARDAIIRAASLAGGADKEENRTKGEREDARLNSIFADASLGGRGIPADAPPTRYRLAPLGPDDSLFPVADAAREGDYPALWEKFAVALKKLPLDAGEKNWLDSYISLLERYLWCIPAGSSGTGASLYDHAAMTAAIAQAILACPAGEEKFLLFGGDLSGIQAFIFGREEPADRGAVRLLRARSFILQAITRSVWLVLLERLDLAPVAKIMDAGGRFNLLLPDTERTRTVLDKLEEEAESWLYDNFLGAIRLNLGRLYVRPEALSQANFGEKFREFGDELEKAKLRPFSRILAKLPFPPTNYEDYGQFGECDYCHSRPGASLEEGRSACRQCRELMELGRELPKAGFIVFGREFGKSDKTYPDLLFDGLGLRFCDKRPDGADAAEALNILSVRGETVFTAIPLALWRPVVTEKDLEKFGDTARIVDANDGEWKLGAPKTFSMLADCALVPPAKPGDSWTSIACLGVCKADVDNLGMIFSSGFGDKFGVSRYAMLARMLNHFFAGYLPELIRSHFPDMYIVFAGGDDVFVIGPWNQAIAFAMRMAADFRKFSGDNPAVTLSAGLPLIKASLPMRAVREEAENCLEASKEYATPAGRNQIARDYKNAVTLFGSSARWREARESLEFGEKLASWREKGLITSGFLRRLLGYARQCKGFYAGRDLAKNAMYLSHFQYDLARNWKPGDDFKAGKTELQKLVNDKDKFMAAEMGISWAIYRTRTS
ncbi:MAG: type III-A CRISPR-associated protein Cas10/Csm1 [Desulfovibrio sp.]|nr:type III-A CRISPR-associated protein Cas10/Csm1 [Desulfovibrio sp.]